MFRLSAAFPLSAVFCNTERGVQFTAETVIFGLSQKSKLWWDRNEDQRIDKISTDRPEAGLEV